MTMPTRRVLLKAAAGSAVLVLPATRELSLVTAQQASPVPIASPSIPAGCVQIASGLMSPRFLALGDDGSVFVTEAGTGGDEVLSVAPPGEEPAATPMASPVASPAPAGPQSTRGHTGQVSKIAPDGSVSVVASGLASYLFGGTEALGPAGIAVDGGTLWVANGGAGPAVATLDAIQYENSVLSIDEATGSVTVVADLGAYEETNNPEPTAVDSNLYGLTLGADGMLYVNDAGGNDVLRVDPASGEISVLAVIPPIQLPDELLAIVPEGVTAVQAVPTGVTPNPAGGLYVSLLSGGPFPPGAAKILAIADDGTISDAATGLTMATDVKVGPDGNLYAAQISLNFLAEPPEPGSVVRINQDGSIEPVVEGLMLPNGLVFDADGNLFVTAVSNNPPGVPEPLGMVLRCDGVAPPA
jgi:hypothetical protein